MCRDIDVVYCIQKERSHSPLYQVCSLAWLMTFVHLEQYWRRPGQREKETDRVGLGERVGEREGQTEEGWGRDRQTDRQTDVKCPEVRCLI